MADPPRSHPHRRRFIPPTLPESVEPSTFRSPRAPIEEESGIDGDSYVATSENQPFGVQAEEEEERREEREGGLTGLLGEMYGGNKW
jgi:hypothetical protein